MYPDQLDNWLHFRHGLLIFLILAAFWQSETGQICYFRAFSWEHKRGMASNLACWCILTTMRTNEILVMVCWYSLFWCHFDLVKQLKFRGSMIFYRMQVWNDLKFDMSISILWYLEKLIRPFLAHENYPVTKGYPWLLCSHTSLVYSMKAMEENITRENFDWYNGILNWFKILSITSVIPYEYHVYEEVDGLFHFYSFQCSV